MKFVDQKQCIAEVLGLTQHAIWGERTREVINNDMRHRGKSGEDGREDVVPALTLRDAMKPITDSVCAPEGKKSASVPLAAVSGKVFAALNVDFAVTWIWNDISLVGAVRLDPWIQRSISTLRLAVALSGLLEISG